MFGVMSSPFRPRGGVPLSDATLQLHSRRVDVPTYDRSSLQRGVVHIGAGNFHRAHQAVYFDDLARYGISDRWGVTDVSLRSPGVKDLLSAQDGLYTVVQRGHDRQTARVVGSIGTVHYAPNDSAAVRAALADAETRIVSLTITGDGYFLNPITDEFDADHPDVRADLVASDSYATAWDIWPKLWTAVAARASRRSPCSAATTSPATPSRRGPRWCRSQP